MENGSYCIVWLYFQFIDNIIVLSIVILVSNMADYTGIRSIEQLLQSVEFVAIVGYTFSSLTIVLSIGLKYGRLHWEYIRAAAPKC